MKKRAVVSAIAILCLLLVFALSLVACDPQDGDESETRDVGDAVFTEDKTAQEIKDAILSSSGYVITNGSDESARVLLYVDDNNCWLFDPAKGVEILFTCESGVFYELMYDSSDKSGTAEKMTADQALEQSEVSPEEGIAGAMRLNFEFYSQWVDFIVADKDGKVVFNEDCGGIFDGYVAGSGYVILSGTTLTLGYKTLVNGEENLIEQTVGQVNNVTFAPSSEILALKAEAVWL